MLASVLQTAAEATTVLQQSGADDAGGGVGMLLFYIVLLVPSIAGLWKVFTKAGEPGWAAIVPIYNFVVYLKIVGRPLWWILLLFIPIVGFIAAIILTHDLSKAFGRGAGFTAGLVFLPFIFMPILGFGSDQYRRPDSSPTPLARAA